MMFLPLMEAEINKWLELLLIFSFKELPTAWIFLCNNMDYHSKQYQKKIIMKEELSGINWQPRSLKLTPRPVIRLLNLTLAGIKLTGPSRPLLLEFIFTQVWEFQLSEDLSWASHTHLSNFLNWWPYKLNLVVLLFPSSYKFPQTIWKTKKISVFDSWGRQLGPN